MGNISLSGYANNDKEALLFFARFIKIGYDDKFGDSLENITNKFSLQDFSPDIYELLIIAAKLTVAKSGVTQTENGWKYFLRGMDQIGIIPKTRLLYLYGDRQSILERLNLVEYKMGKIIVWEDVTEPNMR